MLIRSFLYWSGVTHIEHPMTSTIFQQMSNNVTTLVECRGSVLYVDPAFHRRLGPEELRVLITNCPVASHSPRGCGCWTRGRTMFDLSPTGCWNIFILCASINFIDAKLSWFNPNLTRAQVHHRMLYCEMIELLSIKIKLSYNPINWVCFWLLFGASVWIFFLERTPV